MKDDLVTVRDELPRCGQPQAVRRSGNKNTAQVTSSWMFMATLQIGAGAVETKPAAFRQGRCCRDA